MLHTLMFVPNEQGLGRPFCQKLPTPKATILSRDLYGPSVQQITDVIFISVLSFILAWYRVKAKLQNALADGNATLECHRSRSSKKRRNLKRKPWISLGFRNHS